MKLTTVRNSFRTPVPLLLLMSIFWLPAIAQRHEGIAQAKELNIQTGDVRVSKNKNGNIYVNTGNSRLRLRGNSSSVNVNQDRQYRHINRCSNLNLTRQEVTQVRRTGETVIQTHLSTHQCY